MGYNDRLDPDRQISMEEHIARMIFERSSQEVNEGDCGDLGREILLDVLSEFRKDLTSDDNRNRWQAEFSPELDDVLSTRMNAALDRHSDPRTLAIDILPDNDAPPEDFFIDGFEIGVSTAQQEGNLYYTLIEHDSSAWMIGVVAKSLAEAIGYINSWKEDE